MANNVDPDKVLQNVAFDRMRHLSESIPVFSENVKYGNLIKSCSFVNNPKSTPEEN